MASGKPKKPLMGAHWMETSHPKQYQLFRRVEDVATELANRRINGWGPGRTGQLHGTEQQRKGHEPLGCVQRRVLHLQYDDSLLPLHG